MELKELLGILAHLPERSSHLAVEVVVDSEEGRIYTTSLLIFGESTPRHSGSVKVFTD